MRVPIACCLLVLALVHGAQAEGDGPAEAAPEPRRSLEETARLVIEGHESGADLTPLVARRRPEPWVLLDALMAQGERAAALAFVEAVAQLDADTGWRLAGLLVGGADTWEDAHTRAAYQAAVTLVEVGDLEAALVRLEGTPEPESPVFAVAVPELRGRVLQRLGRLREARDTWRAAIVMAREAAWREKVVVHRDLVATTSFHLGDYDAARRDWQALLEVTERRHDASLELAARVGLAAVALRTDRLDEAERLFQEALDAAMAAGDELAAAVIAANLVSVLTDRGMWREARDRLLVLLPRAEALGAPSFRAFVHHSLGRVFVKLGDAEAAAAHLEAGLELARQGGDAETLTQSLSALGNLRAQAGRYDEALALLEEGMAVAANHGLEASRLRVAATYGNTLIVLGRVGEALPHYERLLDHARAVGDRRMQAASLDDLGAAYWLTGQLERARRHFEASLRISREIRDLDGIARSTGNLAGVLADLGETEAAIELHLESRALEQRLGNAWGAAVSLANVGVELGGMGRHEEALEALEGAYEEMVRTGRHVDAHWVLVELARVAYEQRDDARARAQAERALRFGRRVGSVKVHLRAASLLTQLHWRAERFDDVLHIADEALDEVDAMTVGLAGEQIGGLRAQWTGLAHRGLGAAVRVGGVDDVFRHMERSRARAFLAAVGAREAIRERLPTAWKDAEREARRDEARARGAYHEALAGPATRDQEVLRRAWLEARERRVSVWERIQRSARPEAALFVPDPVTLEEARARLGEGEALLLYAASTPEVWALVVTPQDATLHALGRLEGLHARIDAWHAKRDAASLADLRALLVDPLGLPEDAVRLGVSTDGRLGEMAFGPLCPERDVVHVPSATVLVRQRTEATVLGQGLLAVTDPDTPRVAPLPAARREVANIADVTQSGGASTRRDVRAALAARPRWHAVHFACHGELDAIDPLYSALRLAPDGRDAGRLTALDVYRWDVRADLVALAACSMARGEHVAQEGIIGLTRAFQVAGAHRVLSSLWRVEDEATRFLMERFYARWLGPPGANASTALRLAQADLRTWEARVLDEAASARAGQPVYRTLRPFADPRHWAGWILWGDH